MSETEALMKAVELAHWELSEALKSLPEADVWKRPHPRLLSVGELLAHVAYWEAQSFFGDGFESPLFTPGARYYPSNVQTPYSLDLGAEATVAEVARVHEACQAAFLAAPQPPEEANPHRTGWTWRFTLQYLAFHVAYHAGQIYSARHLLGHETTDN